MNICQKLTFLEFSDRILNLMITIFLLFLLLLLLLLEQDSALTWFSPDIVLDHHYLLTATSRLLLDKLLNFRVLNA